jgi:hypothetical protein
MESLFGIWEASSNTVSIGLEISYFVTHSFFMCILEKYNDILKGD